MTFTTRELTTALAALRYWQQAVTTNGMVPISEHFDGDVMPLTVVEIDDLCERLNYDHGAE